jgi:hypothetical protein
VTHSLSFRTWTQRGASVCVAVLMVTTALVVGLPGSGRSGIPSAGAATIAAVGASKSKCPTGSAPGITSGQVTLAATIIDITGSSLSNATVGVPSTQAQEADYNLVAKKINSEGGAGCRKIVMKFFDVNPVDAANAQQACLTIAASQPYMVLDSGALTEVGAAACIPQHHVLLASQYLTPDDLTTERPYALDIGGNAQQETRTGILAAHQLGYFSAAKGFKKLGVLYHTCTAGTLSIEQSALAAAKVPTKDVDYFNMACPAGQSDTSASMQQAVLSFKNAGVTDVTSRTARRLHRTSPAPTHPTRPTSTGPSTSSKVATARRPRPGSRLRRPPRPVTPSMPPAGSRASTSNSTATAAWCAITSGLSRRC